MGSNPMKPDEIKLLVQLLGNLGHGDSTQPVPMAVDVAQAQGMSPARLEGILESWDENGWWDYGVSPRTGWFENLHSIRAVLDKMAPINNNRMTFTCIVCKEESFIVSQGPPNWKPGCDPPICPHCRGLISTQKLV
jgi:hypothetical protein